MRHIHLPTVATLALLGPTAIAQTASVPAVTWKPAPAQKPGGASAPVPPFRATGPGASYSSGSDDCAVPEVIAGSGNFAYDTTTATTGLEGQNESLCYEFGTTGIHNDVWFDWTADFSGTARLSLCSGGSGDPKIAAWPGGGCPLDGTSLACNDDTCGLLSQIEFPVSVGTSYLLQIGTFPGGSTGSGSFDISQQSTPPSNDDCASPTLISGEGAFQFDTTAATTGVEGQNESLCNSFGSTAIHDDVWFEWTATEDGVATISSCGAATDTRLAAYAGLGCPMDGTAIACNDDFCGSQSEISFVAASGQSYVLQVGHFAMGQGTLASLAINIDPPPCSGVGDKDPCALAEPIQGTGEFCYVTTNATPSSEGSSCLSAPDFQNDVWFEWSPTVDGIYDMETCNGGVGDSIIAVYQMPSSGCAGLECPLYSNDDSCGVLSSLEFEAFHQLTYLLRIGYVPGTGPLGPGGSGRFRIQLPATIGQKGCQSLANSEDSDGAEIIGSGSISLSAADLTLYSGLVPSQPGLFFYGSTAIQVPFGNGFRCVGGTVARMSVLFPVGNVFTQVVDFGLHGPTFSILGTVHFQNWFRDPAGGGAGHNLSDRLTITFVP